MVLSVIMAAYNEVASIWSVVEKDLQQLAALPAPVSEWILVVSDDGGRSD